MGSDPMSIGPIKNEEDYATALAEIDRLMGSPHGSRDGENLDALVTLVDAYEAKHWPIDPPPIRWTRKRSLDYRKTSH